MKCRTFAVFPSDTLRYQYHPVFIGFFVVQFTLTSPAQVNASLSGIVPSLVIALQQQGKRNRDILLFNGQLGPFSDVQLNRAYDFFLFLALGGAAWRFPIVRASNEGSLPFDRLRVPS